MKSSDDQASDLHFDAEEVACTKIDFDCTNLGVSSLSIMFSRNSLSSCPICLGGNEVSAIEMLVFRYLSGRCVLISESNVSV